MSNNLTDFGRGGSFCLSMAGLAIGSTTTGIAIAAPNGAGVDFAINGQSYHKADAATAAITAAAAQAVLTKCIYLICLNVSGTVSSVKGREVTTAALVAGTDVLDWPQRLVNTVAIGAVKITLASTATFTAGTTALNATNVTATYYNLFSIPAEPLTS